MTINDLLEKSINDMSDKSYDDGHGDFTVDLGVAEEILKEFADSIKPFCVEAK